jgi:hypothetical protein
MKVIPETYLMKVIPETYLMKVIPETRCAHYIAYLHCYFNVFRHRQSVWTTQHMMTTREDSNCVPDNNTILNKNINQYQGHTLERCIMFLKVIEE